MSDAPKESAEADTLPSALADSLKPDAFRRTLQSLKGACALVQRDDWQIVFENASFFQWFPAQGEGDSIVTNRLPDFDASKAGDRLGNDRPYRYEAVTRPGGREVPVEIEVHALSGDDDGLLIVECRDISKRRQAEYMLESYSTMAERNARELQREKERVEKLLLNIMPRAVYDEMKDYGTVTPQRFDNASIVMLDFVDFTEMAVSREPSALIGELNDIFTSFDRIVELFGCERIKTIGDAYMAVSGLPEENPDHAQNAARAALRMRRYIDRRNSAHSEPWRCRIGIHSGPVVGSIVGIQK
jgi:class 3 adenylate cyclase